MNVLGALGFCLCMVMVNGGDRKAQEPSIVIVGSGISGLAAADKLINKYGFKNVTILEALDRVGGRIFPIPYGETIMQMGAQWLHNRHNPVFDIALLLGLVRNRNVKPDEANDKSQYFDQNGCEVPTRLQDAYEKFYKDTLETMEDWDYEKHPEMGDLSYGDVWTKLYKKFLKKGGFNESDVKVLDAIEKVTKSGIEFYYAAEDWRLISLKPASEAEEEDEDHEGAISISLGKTGFKAILDEMTRRVPPSKYIQFNSEVSSINYGNSGKTQIKLKNGKTVEADHVIVTSSLGFLKKNAQSFFSPALPKAKLDTINSLGFGAMDKLFLLFDKPFWSNKTTDVNFIRVEGASKSCSLTPPLVETPLTKIFENGIPKLNPPSILFWVGAQNGALFENTPDASILAAALPVLQKFFNNPSIPTPKLLRSAWGTNPLFLGSYSYNSVNCAKIGCQRDSLVEPLLKAGSKIPAVQFAGEATHLTEYSTVHGAFESGLREADRLGKLYR